YAIVRAEGTLGVRTAEEISMFSADTHAFATIAPNARLLGKPLSGYPKAEGEGFVGFTIAGFALVGLVVGLQRTGRSLDWRTMRVWRVFATAGCALIALISFAVVIWLFTNGSLSLPFQRARIVYFNVTRPLQWAIVSTIAIAILVAIDRRGRPQRDSSG